MLRNQQRTHRGLFGLVSLSPDPDPSMVHFPHNTLGFRFPLQICSIKNLPVLCPSPQSLFSSLLSWANSNFPQELLWKTFLGTEVTGDNNGRDFRLERKRTCQKRLADAGVMMSPRQVYWFAVFSNFFFLHMKKQAQRGSSTCCRSHSW